MTKDEIRQYIRLEKRKLNMEMMQCAGADTARALSVFTPYKEAKTLYCYASYNHELPTMEIIKNALDVGKQVALPKVIKETITFYEVCDLSELKPGYQGIPEPATTKEVWPDKNKPALMLLPGLAFTSEGERLGYGGGFYDRYLEKVEKGALVTCGIGYDFQVLPSLPTETFDQTVDYVITPNKILTCASLLYR